MKILIKEDKNGMFLIRRRKEDNRKLLNSFDNLIVDENNCIHEFIDILIINDNKIGYFDYDDFKPLFKCSNFEFKYLLKRWLKSNNIQSDTWTRVSIYTLG